MEGRLDMAPANGPCGRISRSLAFAAMGKGEAWTRRSKGPKPLRRTPLSDSPARRETPTVLNPSNRRIRTRTYGGVGGEEPRGSPLSRSVTFRHERHPAQARLVVKASLGGALRQLDPGLTPPFARDQFQPAPHP